MRRWPSLLLLLLAAGCSPDYPFDRPGTWSLQQSHANDANLRAMIVNPRDLVAGVGEAGTPAAEAAPPVRRLLTGKRYPLPQTSTLQVNLVGGPQQQPGGGEPNAGE